MQLKGHRAMSRFPRDNQALVHKYLLCLCPSVLNHTYCLDEKLLIPNLNLLFIWTDGKITTVWGTQYNQAERHVIEFGWSKKFFGYPTSYLNCLSSKLNIKNSKESSIYDLYAHKKFILVSRMVQLNTMTCQLKINIYKLTH